MYLYSTVIRDGQEQPQDAYPCFICKKMIINAGLERLVSRQADGHLKVYDISEWVNDWQEHDMLDDTEQYGLAINSE